MLGSHILKFSARYYKVLPGFTKYLQVLPGEFGFLAKLKIEREHIWRLVVAHCPLSLRYAGCILGTAEYKSDQTSFQCWTAMVKAVSPKLVQMVLTKRGSTMYYNVEKAIFLKITILLMLVTPPGDPIPSTYSTTFLHPS